MANKINICNSALDKLGVEPIVNFQEQSKAAGLCSRNYDNLRKRMLRQLWWNFAIVRATLNADVAPPAWGFDTQFSLPGDCVRFLQLENSDQRYRIEGTKLLVDACGGSVNILYVQDVDDADSMTEDFREGLAYLLATELAYPLLQSRSVASDMYNKYKLEISEIRTIDSQISSHDGMLDSAWLNARCISGRTSGDRSYYW